MQQPAAADSGKQQERMVVVAVAVAGATPGWKNIPPSWALFWRDIFPSLILFRFIIGRSEIGIQNPRGKGPRSSDPSRPRPVSPYNDLWSMNNGPMTKNQLINASMTSVTQ